MDKRILLTRIKKSYFFVIGSIGVVFLLLVCFVLPSFLPWSATDSDISSRLLAPEYFSKGFNGHILGTDSLGRDVLTRLLVGGQYSYMLGVVVVIINVTVGAVLGLISGYFGKWADTIIMRLCDAIQAMPTLILAIAIIAMIGRSTLNLVIVMTITGWGGLARITRNNVRLASSMEYVKASTALGAKSAHIMFSQIFPNVTTQIILTASSSISRVIMMEASLSFLGLGVVPPAPSWGHMITTGRQYLTTQPWLIVVPGCALLLSVLSFNFLGDGTRDVLDAKRRA